MPEDTLALASASALRSARDTGFVSIPCPSTAGTSRPTERSAFIVAMMIAWVEVRLSTASVWTVFVIRHLSLFPDTLCLSGIFVKSSDSRARSTGLT